ASPPLHGHIQLQKTVTQPHKTVVSDRTYSSSLPPHHLAQPVASPPLHVHPMLRTIAVYDPHYPLSPPPHHLATVAVSPPLHIHSKQHTTEVSDRTYPWSPPPHHLAQ